MGRRTVTAVVCAAALAVPVADAVAAGRSVRAATKKIVVMETVTGPSVKCHAWGFMEVRLTVQKTELVNESTGKKTLLSVKIPTLSDVSWPIYPDHTPRSKYINAQALPLLQQETFQLQMNAAKQLQNISGASNTTVSWLASLQAALVKAETP